MKKSTLRIAIRAIVREEVAEAIQEVITELKQPTLEKKPKKKKVIREKQNFTSNKILNGVLNETANNVNEWETMGGTEYTSERMGELVGGNYKNLMSDDSENSNGSLAMEMGVNPNDAPDFLTKDYRAVMKAIDKKQGKI